MPRPTGPWARIVRALAVLSVLASAGTGAALGQGPSAPPAMLPPKLVAAWQNAGGRAGWMRVNPYGTLVFLPEQTGKAGDVPAFRFHRWEGGVVARLPAP